MWCFIGFLWHFPDFKGGYFYLCIHPFLYLNFSSGNTCYFHNIERSSVFLILLLLFLLLVVVIKRAISHIDDSLLWWLKSMPISGTISVRTQESLLLWGGEWVPLIGLHCTPAPGDRLNLKSLWPWLSRGGVCLCQDPFSPDILWL